MTPVPESATVAEERLLEWRSSFPILASSTYLISNSLGAMPAGVRDSLGRYADTWAERGVRAWEDEWWTLAGRVGDAIGRIIGAPEGTVSTHQNVTLASAVIASCFDFEGVRNGIVCSDLNFPSIIQLYRQHERRGARLRLVESADGFTVPTEAMLEAIDETTLLVPVSHVIFRSSWIQDARAIIERAHEVGALVVLDAYQSVGAMPLDVRDLGVDFAVGGVLKWLCGGPGVAWLYADPEVASTLEPAITGWFARENAFAFDAHDDSYRDGAWRFANGTTHIPSLYACLPGLEILGQQDMELVRRKSLRQTGRLTEAALERGWTLRSPTEPQRRAGHVVVDLDDAERLATELLRERIMIDHRPGAGIRIAPHFYTTDGEVEHAIRRLSELAAQ